MAEDNQADIFLIREALAKLGAELEFVNDGEKAIRYMDRVDASDDVPCPSLIIIDINLPKKHGGEVLAHLRKSRRCASAPVLVVTSSDSEEDRHAMARLGIDAYFRKPSDYEEFLKLGDVAGALLSGTPEAPKQ